MERADRAWLEAHGTHVQYRASLEQDLAAMREVRPDLAVGTTPLVQKAKALGIPALYFTNMVSARPLFGPAGAGALAAIVAAQTKGRERFAPHGELLRQGRRGRNRRLWLHGRSEGSARLPRPLPHARARRRRRRAAAVGT